MHGTRPICHQNIWEDIYAMVTMRLGSFQVTHVYGHNSVPHNEEADKVANAGARMLVACKVRRRQAVNRVMPREQ